MGFFKKLFSRPPASHGRFYSFSVKCKRCGEIVHGQVNISNDPSLELDENDKPYYICRKVLIGSGHCFQQIEVTLKFNEQRGVTDRQISGGEFVED